MMKILKAVLLLIVLMLTLGVTLAFSGEMAESSNPIIVDVRTEAEWATGHLEGAVLIPYEKIGDGIVTVTTDKKSIIYLYCRTGRRTGIAYESLKKAGYENLINLGTVENASKELNRKIVK